MNINNTITFTIYPQYCDEILDKILPQDLAFKIQPKSFKQRIWLPQSMGDCIWLWYEFETEEEKKNYINLLNKIFSKDFLHAILATNITQETIDFYIGTDSHKFIFFDFLTGSMTTHD